MIPHRPLQTDWRTWKSRTQLQNEDFLCFTAVKATFLSLLWWCFFVGFVFARLFSFLCFVFTCLRSVTQLSNVGCVWIAHSWLTFQFSLTFVCLYISCYWTLYILVLLYVLQQGQGSVWTGLVPNSNKGKKWAWLDGSIADIHTDGNVLLMLAV